MQTRKRSPGIRSRKWTTAGLFAATGIYHSSEGRKGVRNRFLIHPERVALVGVLVYQGGAAARGYVVAGRHLGDASYGCAAPVAAGGGNRGYPLKCDINRRSHMPTLRDDMPHKLVSLLVPFFCDSCASSRPPTNLQTSPLKLATPFNSVRMNMSRRRSFNDSLMRRANAAARLALAVRA